VAARLARYHCHRNFIVLLSVLQGKRLSYCEVSGYPLDVAAACSSNPSCKAFTTTSTSGGYLKTASGPTSYTEGTTVYVKA